MRCRCLLSSCLLLCLCLYFRHCLFGCLSITVFLCGYDATRAIRVQEQEQGRQACWIIGLSAHAGADAVSAAEQAGMNDYLCKPVTRDQLRQALQRASWPGRH